MYGNISLHGSEWACEYGWNTAGRKYNPIAPDRWEAVFLFLNQNIETLARRNMTENSLVSPQSRHCTHIARWGAGALVDCRLVFCEEFFAADMLGKTNVTAFARLIGNDFAPNSAFKCAHKDGRNSMLHSVLIDKEARGFIVRCHYDEIHARNEFVELGEREYICVYCLDCENASSMGLEGIRYSMDLGFAKVLHTAGVTNEVLWTEHIVID
jgi:hypothetical protein